MAMKAMHGFRLDAVTDGFLHVTQQETAGEGPGRLISGYSAQVTGILRFFSRLLDGTVSI
jgi:hypothetical protein